MSEYHLWDRYKKVFDGVHFTLQGHSISARCSGFWIPEFQVMFDAGICAEFNPLHIFITHTHTDHAYMIAQILSGINTKPYVYVPRGTAALVCNLLMAKHALSRCDANAIFNIDDICTLVEVGDGDVLPITVRGNQSMIVRVFATDHKITSVGFALFYVRQRLLPEFASLSGSAIAQKRKEGAQLYVSVHVPCVAYVGDSTPKWLQNDIFDTHEFPLILCECTFVGALESDSQRAIAAAIEHGHTEWSQLEPLISQKIASGAKTVFCLVHWSNRYEMRAIDAFFKEKLQIFAWTN